MSLVERLPTRFLLIPKREHIEHRRVVEFLMVIGLGRQTLLWCSVLLFKLEFPRLYLILVNFTDFAFLRRVATADHRGILFESCFELRL